MSRREMGVNCEIGEHVAIAEGTVIGDRVTIGNFVTVYPGVHIEDDCRVMDGAVIGRLSYRTHFVRRVAPTDYLPVHVGAGSVIGCNCVLYTGVTLDEGVLLADGASVREGCVLANGVFLGRSVMLNYDVHIGKETRVMDLTHITGRTRIGEDCFISILVATANDKNPYVSRYGRYDGGDDFEGPTIGNHVVIGAAACINPGLHIGDGAMVASGAVVTHDVEPWTIVMGVPARAVRGVPEEWRSSILHKSAQ